MPHATNEMPNMTNGDKASSKFITHVTSYPVVNDGIETFKSHPYGKKSLELAGDAYQRFGKPVEPYLETPLSYVKPYADKADELATSGLEQVDTRFPIVKEDTATVVETGKSYVYWPYNYVTNTYNDEYRKTANHNKNGFWLLLLIQAVISTELRIASDFFQAVADFLGPKYEESKKKGADYVRQAQDAAGDYKKIGEEKIDEYKKFGEQKLNEYTKAGQEKGEQVKQQGKEAADQAKQQGQQAKEDAKAKTGSK